MRKQMDMICRACAEPIRWVRAKNGRLMPCDVLPNENGTVDAVDENGNAVKLMSHSATCPFAPRFRKKVK